MCTFLTATTRKCYECCSFIFSLYTTTVKQGLLQHIFRDLSLQAKKMAFQIYFYIFYALLLISFGFFYMQSFPVYLTEEVSHEHIEAAVSSGTGEEHSAEQLSHCCHLRVLPKHQKQALCIHKHCDDWQAPQDAKYYT